MAMVVIDSRLGVVSRTEIAGAMDARRRSLRVNTAMRLITTGAPGVQPDAALMEVSRDGFRLATTEPLEVDSRFLCALMPNLAMSEQPRARVVACNQQRPDGHAGGYVSRFEFDGPDAA